MAKKKKKKKGSFDDHTVPVKKRAKKKTRTPLEMGDDSDIADAKASLAKMIEDRANTKGFVIQRPPNSSSIELCRDAKGKARWTIKLYCEGKDAEETIDEALRLDGILRERTQENE